MFPTAIGKFFAPAMLAAVALVQLGTVGRTGLSPWKGGGFGMFAKSDWRHVDAKGVTESGEIVDLRLQYRGEGRYGPLTGELGRRLDKIKSEEYLRQLGTALMTYRFVPVEAADDAFLQNVIGNPSVDQRVRQLAEERAARVRLGRRRFGPVFPGTEYAEATEVVALASVSLQAFEMTFDPDAGTFVTHAVGAPVVIEGATPP